MQPPAGEAADDGKRRKQRQQPAKQSRGRLLQIGFDGNIRQQQPGKHNGKLQNGAQRVGHGFSASFAADIP